MKIIFAGTPDFAVPCLQALIDSEHEIVAVYTQPDRVSGRGRKLQMSPVKQLAQAHALRVEQPVSLRDQAPQQTLKALQAELMIVVAYGLILPKQVLEMPKQGCINVHASLLPRWRGAAPIQYAILAGDQYTGVTIMQMVEALDAGDMLASSMTEVRSVDTSQTLHDRLASMGAELLIETLGSMKKGQLQKQPQDETLVTYAPKIKKTDAELDWGQEATTLLRKIRAFYGWPVAYTHFSGQVLRVWEATLIKEEFSLEPGTVLSQDKKLIVCCKKQAIALLKVQLPGGKVIAANDLLNAVGDRIESGKTILTRE